MESVAAAAISTTSRSLPLPFSSTPLHRRRRSSFLPVAASKRHDDDKEAANGREPTGLAPYGLSFSPLSKDAAMGLVVSAATGSGWTTGSGMEGPPTASRGGGADRPEISTLPWSLFTKSPRRRMRVAFTCNVCGQRTTRAINPHAYTDGTVFVQLEEDMWLSSSSDSDGLIYSDNFDYVMDLDDIYLYGNGDEHSSEEDEDTSSEEDDCDDSAKEDDDGDNSTKEGVDDENGAEDVSDG